MTDIKVFNNLAAEELVAGDGLKNYDGWAGSGKYDTEKINKIKDTVENGGIGYFKLGTSIPTPFARIFMFRNAFNRVGKLVDERETIYGKLVSECLDFLEFIFHFGNDITVKKWSFKNDINLLMGVPLSGDNAMTESKSEDFDLDSLLSGTGDSIAATAGDDVITGHKLLAECLNNQRSELGGIENIYLIYYKGQLMGGTSPFTLVFTSPNWQRHKNCGIVKGDGGNELFPNYQEDKVMATPLHLRHQDFVLFLLTYRRAYSVEGSDNSLMDYIANSLPYINQKNPKLKQADDKLATIPQSTVRIAFEKKYSVLKCNDDPVNLAFIEGSMNYLPLGYVVTGPVNGIIDYTIVPDYPEFTIYDENEKPHIIKDALVLTDSGIQGARYVGGRPWNTDDKPSPNIVDVPLWERLLPGAGNHKQPFITVYDMFEDYLIRVPYTLNADRFETFIGRKWKFLLPIKRRFFDFFKKDRLTEWLTIDATDDDSQVTFVLRIPITFVRVQGRQEFIEVKKIYKKDAIKDMRGGSWFAMAMFPNYRIMDCDEDNRYTIMAGNGRDKVNLAFYNASHPQNAIEVTKTVRPDDIGSTFYHIEKRVFDFIEVAPDFTEIARPIHALVIPKFIPAYLDDTDSSWKFSIDFGTTNTYIAAMDGGSPVTFEIGKNDMQVAYLDQLDLSKGIGSSEFDQSIKSSGVAPFHDAANREFAPLLIGPDGIASYPFQTVTCESNAFKNVDGIEKHLFSHIAIGYNLNNEEFSQNYVYRTDIKWAVDKEKDGPKRNIAETRMRLYCQQIAWMLKNKIALSSSETHHVGRKFVIYYTYPCSMNRDQIGKLKKMWAEAFDIDLNNPAEKGRLIDMTESEAPYYFLTRKGDVSGGSNFLNVDVGGGTTDMFFVIQDSSTGRNVKKSYYTSMRFAGNDIWGDGVDGTAKLTNGFYKKVKQGLPFMAEEISKQEKIVMGNADSNMSSADTMAFLFRNDNPTTPQIPTLIQTENKKLYPLLLVHFGALMYHVAMILKDKEWDIPKTVNFTGMGSKYVHIIADPENISFLAGMLLKKFSGKELPDGFSVTYSPNAKQVTAQGALMRDSGAVARNLEGKPEEFQVYGASPLAFGDPIFYKDAEENSVRDQVLGEYEKFIKTFLEDRVIVNEIKQNYHAADISDWLISGLRSKAQDSYISVCDSFVDKDLAIKETLFFWPLKNALYELSKDA